MGFRGLSPVHIVSRGEMMSGREEIGEWRNFHIYLLPVIENLRLGCFAIRQNRNINL